jgi:hypothetical protein
MAARKNDTATIEVSGLDTSTIVVRIVGTTPMICNSMSAKAKQDLLLGSKKKNRAEKETTAKHDPLREYRESPYRTRGDEEAARIIFPAGGVKKALAQAALDIPGANKSQIGRLSWVEGRNVPIYGIPQIYTTVVRSADMARTPDMRTRAILPEWATEFAVTFVRPNLTEQAVANLLAAAGIIVGLGDYRPEKGKGNFGQFRLAGEGDAEWERIVRTGGREAQDQAFDNPVAFDVETEELLEWYRAEVERRGFKVA